MANGCALALLAPALVGCAGAGLIRVPEGPVGMAHRPALEEAFVTPRATRGDTIRVYVRASDPDGDLDGFVVSLEQTTDRHPQEVVRLPEKVRAISGYIDFPGAVPPHSQPLGELQVWVHLQAEDRAGNRSETRRLPLLISDRRMEQVPPPEGRFDAARRLGWLGTTLRTPYSMLP